MDSSLTTKNDEKDFKYDSSIVQNTLHKQLVGIIDKIEPQKKHAFLDIISNSLNLILSCFKCKSLLKDNSSSFNCGHKYCEQCSKNLKKCTSCNEGNIRTDIKNFSGILNAIDEIKSNFNSDKVLYEIMRYLLMPEKFTHAADVVEFADDYVECTPADSLLHDQVDLKKFRKTSLQDKKLNAKSPASKNSRKKLEFNKDLNGSKNTANKSTAGNESGNLFSETTKNKKKVDEKRQSYLELQSTVSELNNGSTPKSNSKRKRKSNESYLELQPTISDMFKTPVSNTKRKRKMSDTEPNDQNNSKSKRIKMKINSEDSLIEEEKSEPKSLRKKALKQLMKSPQRSSDSSNQGEEKQQNATETKTTPVVNSIKNSVGETKNSLVQEPDMDADVLDLNVWKHNDRYERKKSLFKSVKERNKRNKISVGGGLTNLLENRKITPKKQSPIKSDLNRNENIEMKKTKNIKLDTVSTNPTEEKTSKLGNEDTAPETADTDDRVREEPNPVVLIQKLTPKKRSPNNSNTNPYEETEVKSDEVLPTDDKKKYQKSDSMNPKKSKTSRTKVLEEPVPEVEIANNVVGKEPSKETEKSEKILDEEHSLIDLTEEKTSQIGVAVENAVSEKELSKASRDREILAEITDHQQNCRNNENSAEKPRTPFSPAKSDAVSKQCGKLGLPLFPETNTDIFSQKGNLCSSTPCVSAMKKITKTYSRAKNNLFNKSYHDISPIAEEKIRDDKLIFLDFSPIAEKEECDELFKSATPVDKMAHLPIDPEDREKFPASDDSSVMVARDTQLIVVAEVHDVPATPTTLSAEEMPKQVQSKKHQSFQPEIPETLPVKNSRLDEIIPMEVDNAIETVEKVTENILSKTLESNVHLEDEIQTFDSDVERETKVNKAKKLQESINNKTHKALSSLKKNFNKNTSKLSVEKVKSCLSSTTPAKSSHYFAPVEAPPSTSSDKNELNVVSTPLSKNLSNDYNDAPTQKRGTPTKEVACQTSPGLHLALLKQEFPDLFEKHMSDSTKKNYPPSVYDTPTEPINEGVKITAKTPDIRLLDTTAKYTLVSSITSSEKKRIDDNFMNESVLGNATIDVISANKTTNISGYTPLSPETLNGKKKLSCRLNFDDNDDKKPEQEIPEDVLPTELSVELPDDSAIKTATDFSVDRSNEIDFSDHGIDKKDEEDIVSASILENTNVRLISPASAKELSQVSDDVNKTFFESDRPVATVSSATKTLREPKEDADSTLMAIPDTEDVAAYNDDKNEVVTDDDDDIDFVAGTPTSQPRRLLADTLEKIRTPHNLLRKPLDISLQEFSIVGNRTPDLNIVQPLPDVSQYSVVKKPAACEVTPSDEPAKKIEDFDREKVSMELFNSSVSLLSSACDQIQIATSGLKEPDLRIIREFCEKFSATYVDKLTEKSTHLIVKTNHKNRAARTFKYLQAIVSEIRIVSMKWIHECLTKEKIINEEKFIPFDSSGECGPLRTYHVIKGVTPSPLSWLNDYCIYFTEPVPQECSLEQLQGIMRKTGAIVVNSLREFKLYPKLHHIIIVSDDEDNDDEYEMKIAGWLQSYEAVSVEFNWILEVIGRNRLMPFADFEVIEVPSEYLLQRNFPSVMLQSNEEDQNSSD
ncbi:titin homolog isoform X2 [Planococcus citri]|uniref:titin homolog isoform X2 n=1 Tax=Planococcus citri TaxID=170843 RepID=UPI0031F77AA5